MVIVGAGGCGREVLAVVRAIEAGTGEVSFLGFIDDKEPDADLLARSGATYLGGLTAMADQPREVRYVIAIGDGKVRERIDRQVTALGHQPLTLVHPRASLGTNIELGPGTIICANTALTTNIRTGRHVHVNVNSTVGHESLLEDYVTLYPMAAVSGTVRLGRASSIGTGAAVIQGCTIGAGAFVGAGAAVVRDIPADVVAVGVPARPRAAE